MESEEKKSAHVAVRMPYETEKRLRAVAAAKGVEAAELMRRAVIAIIEYSHNVGDVPLDMQIVQRRIKAPEMWLAAESPGDYFTGQAKGTHVPEKPPDKSKRKAS